MQALRNSTFVWAPSAGTTELCTNFFDVQICFGEKRCGNEIKKVTYKKKKSAMVLPISMSVHEIQCGSLVHFCMVNLGYTQSGHHSNLVLRLAHTARHNGTSE